VHGEGDRRLITMHDVYVSRYVARTLPDLVRDLGPAHRVVGALSVDVGEPERFHDWMWLVPVSWHRGDAGVVHGHLRVIAVTGGEQAVTELLLVGDRTAADDLDVDALLDDLVDRLPLTAPKPSPSRAA
jgi:hypothetical protein